MPSFQLTEKLLSTPLFQGISKSDLHTIVGHTRFDFGKHAPGKTIVKEGEPCTNMIFLLDGMINAKTQAADNRYTVTEFIKAPMQLQPERLFGMNQRYTTTFSAETACNTLSLMKSEVIKLCNNYDIFRINLINLLAAGVQKAEDRNWLSGHISQRMRIARFFTMHCIRPAGEKIIKIKMRDLAEEINDTRLNVSFELNRLQDEGLVQLSREKIHIPAIEHLFM